MKRALFALLLVACTPGVVQPQPQPASPPLVSIPFPLPIPSTAPLPVVLPTPEPACLTVRLSLRDGTLALIATEPAAVVLPLIRVLVAGVPGGLTGADGIRLPTAGLYVQSRPDLSVEVFALDGWHACPIP